MLKTTRIYANGPTKKGVRELEADIFQPEGEGPFDLLVWMHSGGFRSGSRSHRAHARMAGAFGAHGIAMAFIDYRLARPKAILSDAVAGRVNALIAEAEASGEEMTETFYGPRPLAVVEDCCAFLRRAEEWAEELRLSSRYLLGGSSSGAISALNTLYLAGPLGLERPEISTILSFSGGFAYTPSLHPTGARIMALHNAADEKIPISSIRRLAETTPDPMLLIESEESGHGDLAVAPEEPLETSVARCVAFDRAADIHAFDVKSEFLVSEG